MDDPEKEDSKRQEKIIATLAGADHGKSTLISVLANKITDDGRGSARALILKHNHEKESGRTSTIGKVHLMMDQTDQLIDSIAFIDLAGHQKYLKTTVHGLTSFPIDYVLLLVGANMGITKITKEHLSLANYINVPVIVVITKTDLVPDQIVKDTYQKVKEMLKKSGKYKFQTIINDQETMDRYLNCNSMFQNHCPVFKVSNKDGCNIDLLREFLIQLPNRDHYEMIKKLPVDHKPDTDRTMFRNHDVKFVKGIGLVLIGYVMSGDIKTGSHMFLGPIHKKWIKIAIKSIHDDFKNVAKILRNGEAGCLAIKCLDHKFKLNRNAIKKGCVVVDKEYPLITNFEADIYVHTGHSTTITIGYQPVINCQNIVQSCRLTQIDGKIDKNIVLRSGARNTVNFKFLYRPEYVEVGDLFLLREGNMRGVGRINKLI